MRSLPGVGEDLSRLPVEMDDAGWAVAATIAHGTHAEALAWAAGRARPGAVLEIGSGWSSTPWLHGWCESTERWLLTIETEPDWAADMGDLYGSVLHEVRQTERGVVELPEEDFALALIDGINEDRAAWLDALHSTRTVCVVHDTERTRDEEMPGVADVLDRFEHLREFNRVYPHTSVVWNGGR